MAKLVIRVPTKQGNYYLMSGGAITNNPAYAVQLDLPRKDPRGVPLFIAVPLSVEEGPDAS